MVLIAREIPNQGPPSQSIFQDNLRRLPGYHKSRQDRERPGRFREHRRIYDAQPIHAANAEPGVENGHRIVVGAYSASAARVVRGGLQPEELLNARIRAVRGTAACAGPDLVEGREARVRRDVALRLVGESHGLGQGLQVFVPSSRFEVAEVDLGRLERVAGPQRDRALGRPARVRLRESERHLVWAVVVREARPVPLERDIGYPGVL